MNKYLLQMYRSRKYIEQSNFIVALHSKILPRNHVGGQNVILKPKYGQNYHLQQQLSHHATLS